MILVTAAGGQVGGSAARELLRRGADVRVLVRDPERVELGGAELVQGSYEDEASLERALCGVATVFLAGRDSPEYVAQLERVIAAAERAGVAQIVALSAIAAAPDSPVVLLRDHSAIEQRVRRARVAAFTFLRPHLFLQNLLRAAEAVRLHGRLVAPMGELRVPFVDTGDVGAAAASVLVAPERHAGATYALTGPAARTYEEVAAGLGALLGRAVSYEAALPEDYEAVLRASGVPGWRAYDLAHIAEAYAPGDHAVSQDLPSLLGRPARSLEQFLEAERTTFLGR